MARAKQAGDPKFGFLFGGDPGSDADVGSQFYDWKKAQLREQVQAVDAVPGPSGLVPSQGSLPTAQSQQEEPMSPASSDDVIVADDAVQHGPSAPNVQLPNNLDRAAAPSSLHGPAAKYSSSTRSTSAAAVPGTGEERDGRGEAGDGFAVARKQQPADPPPLSELIPPSKLSDERLPPPPRPGRRKTGFDRPAMEEVGAEQAASARLAPENVAADASPSERKQEPDRSNPERTSLPRTRQYEQLPRRAQGQLGKEEVSGRADKVDLAGPRPRPSDGKDSSRGAGGGRTDGHKEELEQQAAVDEFGRLQRPGGDDSDSDLGSPRRRKDGRRTQGPWPRTSRSPVPANRHRRSPNWRHSPRSRRDRSSSPQMHVSRGMEGDRREPLQRGAWQPADRDGGGRGPQDSRGGRVNACFHYARGHCARGDSCKFLHTRTSGVAQGPEAGRDRYNAGRARESDTMSSRRGPYSSQGRHGGHAAGRAEGDEWFRNRSPPEGPPHVGNDRRDPSASPRSREVRRRADGLQELPANAAAQTDPRPVGREPGGAVLRPAQLGSWSPSLEPTPSSHAQSTSPGLSEGIPGRGGKALKEQGPQDVTSDERRALAAADPNRLAGSSAALSDTPHTRQAQQQHQRHTDAGPQPLTQGTNSGWQDCPPVWHRDPGQPRGSSPAGHMHATSGLDAASEEGRLQFAAVQSRPEQQDSRPWAVAEARATHVTGSQALIVPQGAGNGGRLNGSSHFEEDRPAPTVATVHVDDAGLSEGIDRVEPAWTVSSEEVEKRLQVVDVEMAEPVRKESKGAHLLRVAIAEWVKEELKSAWKEKRLTKEGFKLVAKKAVDKVVGALQPHQVPQSSHQVQAFFTSAQKDKMAKLVKGYIEKHRKAQT
eukprot:SM000010S04220  [mRNA]  locus=s10:295494:299296:+ [translate_table: standard]